MAKNIKPPTENYDLGQKYNIEEVKEKITVQIFNHKWIRMNYKIRIMDVRKDGRLGEGAEKS